MSTSDSTTELPCLVRREVVETAQTLIVKIGTNVLSNADDTLNVERIRHIAEQIHLVRETGRKVVIVTSGSVGAGMGLLGLTERPKDLPHLQAAAATGQAHLIRLYDDCLRPHGYHAAQLLLTTSDFKERSRYLNVRNTLHTLFEYGAVPIINENDTISVHEIKFGDNDHLAAMVTHLFAQPLLVILSVVDGLFDGDPSQPDSHRISLVDRWDNQLLNCTVATGSTRGTGGMRSKLHAVHKATAVGENVVIADGTRPNVLQQILAGDDIGTLFMAEGMNVPAWKRWIGYTVAPKGRVVVDAGARRAIVESGRSLLAIGVTRVEGEYARGEAVAIVDESGQEFARGLSNYDAADTRKIQGCHTEDFTMILGCLPYSELVHRDNLVVTDH
ncbi:glutamate 5-kinase [Thalassoroseus pseudoceratinae]|uniref:glutamate 5-kinase n=1 Tax=Thalassoroseus pseudoceratinae TaxID=2713176 RepID=UPI00141F940A|nr:glutamate 5-kinase [Thalassoroseus pseudoceratinae]